jgi:hypothetical protein
MNTVAHPPQSDGKQPAGEAHSSRRTPLAAPLFTNPLGIPDAVSSALTRGDDNAKSASVSEYDSDLIVGRRHVQPNSGAGHQPLHDSATYNPLAESDADGISAPIPTPQASSSQAAAGNSASIAHDLGALPLSLPRPATPSGSGGEPGIPSDDAGGAKMDDANRPGRAPHGGFHYAKSSRAAFLSEDPCLSAQLAMGIR